MNRQTKRLAKLGLSTVHVKGSSPTVHQVKENPGSSWRRKGAKQSRGKK
jgi:hypothetical protein